MAEFESQTYEAILERLKSRITDEEDKRPGSIVHDLLSPFAIELALAYIEMDNVLDLGFIDTTYGDYVDRRAAEQALERKSAIKSVGVITLDGQTGTVVVKGTNVATADDSPIVFTTLEEVALVEGGVQVDVEAEVGGKEGNVSEGDISIMLGDLSGIVTVTNEAPFTGGFDEESDEELIERYKEKVSRPASSGNKYDYEQWAKEVPGIAEAKCYPLWNGAGTVKVVVTNSERRSPSQPVIDSVIAYIADRHPIGASVTVSGVTEVPIDVSANITLTNSGDIEVAKREIREGLTSYFKFFAFIQTVIRYTQIGNVVLEASGVLDYEDLRINGLSANIELQSDEVPILGALSIEIN